MHPDLHTDLDNLDSVENNLRHSAKGSNDGYDVTFLVTGYEPNDTVSNELIDSQGPLFYVTPSSDQDIDDTTLGKLLAEVHRETPITAVRKVCLSVRRECLSRPIERGNSWKRVTSISLVFGVRNAYSAHNQFSENTQAEKVVDRTGKP